ncbi:MAG TPA: ABC transporter permease [Dissulfurispiraceae bacterium]
MGPISGLKASQLFAKGFALRSLQIPGGKGMFWLAGKTLLHERARLVMTVAGISFSTVLVLTQVGIYLGMVRNATAVIRNTDADIWVTPKSIRNFDFATPVPEERTNRVKALPEVLWVENLIVTWGFLKLPNGGQEQVQIIGFNPDSGVGAPWNMVEGSPFDVKGGRYMIMDKTSEKRIGNLRPGTLWELNGTRFRLVGLSEGIKSFTTTPVIFMSYGQAQNLMFGTAQSGQTTYIIAKLKNRERTQEVADILRRSMRNNDVLTRDDFVLQTVKYWTIQTGVGMSFFLTALLGLMIGGAISGQTIYSNTMQHLKEYGTLKAMGAKNEDIYKTIFSQAGINAVLGFSLGSSGILLLKSSIEKAGVPLYIDFILLSSLFVLVMLTCLFAAWFSVRKIKTIDPVMVFRG